MILETLVAASIYSGAIAYLASDSPIQTMAPTQIEEGQQLAREWEPDYGINY